MGSGVLMFLTIVVKSSISLSLNCRFHLVRFCFLYFVLFCFVECQLLNVYQHTICFSAQEAHSPADKANSMNRCNTGGKV